MYQLLGIDQFGKKYQILSNRKIDEIDGYTSKSKNKKELLNDVSCTSLESFVDVKLIFIKPKTKELIELPIMYYFDIFKPKSVRYCYREFLLNNRSYIRPLIDDNYEKGGTNSYNLLCDDLMHSNLDRMSSDIMKKFDKFLDLHLRSYRKCRDTYFFLKNHGSRVACENKRTRNDIIDFNDRLVGFATDRQIIWERLIEMDLDNISNDQLIDKLLYLFNMDIYYLSQHLVGMNEEDSKRDDLFDDVYYKVFYPSCLGAKKKRQLGFFDIYSNINGNRKK